MRIVVILMLAVALGGTGSFAIGVFDFLTDALKMVDKIIGISNGLDDLTGQSKHEELLHRFDAMTDSIQGQGRDVNSIIGMLKNMESAGQRGRWDLTVETFESLLRDITSNYDRFTFYQKNTSAIERFTLMDFAKTAVSHDSHSLQSTMYSLRDVVLGNDLRLEHPKKSGHPDTPDAHGRQKRYAVKQGLFRELKSLVEVSRLSVCGFDKSPQQLVYGLYGTLVMVLAKDYSMTQFAYMLLRLFGEGSFKAESEYFTESYKTISLAVAAEASEVMSQMQPVFWRCDPPQHERGTTYEEVSELLQGHLENEVDLSNSNSCAGSCSDYRAVRTSSCFDATGHPNSSSAMLCERQRPCNGTLHGCRFVAASATVCMANPKEGTHRRYNWIQYSNGYVMGRKSDASLGSCDGTPKVSSWLRAFVQCSSCFCLCDDDTHSERYFSLLPVMSDVNENKIVTGVRFVKMDGVFYIQVEQGEADRLGYVKSSTIQWKPTDRRIDLNKDVEGRDFVRLSYENRSVLLQDLRGSPGQVVTGVTFHIVGGHLSLKIRVTAISDTAALTPSFSLWLSGNASDPDTPALELPSDPVPPTQSAASNWPGGRLGQTLKFEASSLSADAAQTTLPLLDVQPVAPRPAVWLTGVGLFHKGQKGGGGFLGLSVQMADMSLPEDTQRTLVKTAGGFDREMYRVSSGGQNAKSATCWNLFTCLYLLHALFEFLH